VNLPAGSSQVLRAEFVGGNFALNSITFSTGNLSPVADAGGTYIVTDIDGDGVADVTLDGSGSYDPEGSALTYVWFVPHFTIGGGVTRTESFTVGTHDIYLTVYDEDGNSHTDQGLIIVEDNVAPLEIQVLLLFVSKMLRKTGISISTRW